MFICELCGQSDFIFELRLDNYPLTNVYLDTQNSSNEYLKDAVLFQCNCGHVQLNSQHDCESIYVNDYPYDGEAPTVQSRREKGVSLIRKYLKLESPSYIVDIGCGQLSMINRLGDFYRKSKLIAMDPVPLKFENMNARVEFINDYFRGQLKCVKNSGGQNLFILDNVLEHIHGVSSFMENISLNTNLGDLVYVCVPSFDVICTNLQFHEIIHEHRHYYTLDKLNSLFRRYGFHLIESFSNYENSRAYNYHLFVKGKKSDHGYAEGIPFRPISNRVELYSKTLRTCLENINLLSQPIWGVCASELTPTLAYFMGSNLDFCSGIFDTSAQKVGKYMVNVTPKITPMNQIEETALDSYFFITAPSLTYPVLQNLDRFNRKSVIFPQFLV